MRPALHVTFIAAGLFAAAAVSPSIAADELLVAPEWDPARATAIVEAARTAQRQGDLLAAEHLCYGYATIVDRSALAAYDAYADLLKAEQRTEEAPVRVQAARLHEVKASAAQGGQPASTYLGFMPADGLAGYADLLQSLGRSDEAGRMRTLADAYRQVQQMHFARTMLWKQGKDPRGNC